MSDATDAIRAKFRSWLRKYLINGVASSGANQPDKSAGIAAGDLIATAIDAVADTVASLSISAAAGIKNYASVAAAKADGALANGSLFSVLSADDDGLLDIYTKVSSSVATLLGTFPKLSAITDEVTRAMAAEAGLALIAGSDSPDSPAGNVLRGVADGSGNICFAILDDGTVVFNNPALGSIALFPDAARSFIRGDVDDDNNMGAMVTPDGQHVIPGVLSRPVALAYLAATGGHVQAWRIDGGSPVQLTSDAVDVVAAAAFQERLLDYVDFVSPRIFGVPRLWRSSADGVSKWPVPRPGSGGIIWHFPSTGQSLSVGFDFNNEPPIRSTPRTPGLNLMFNTGVRAAGNNPPEGGNGYDSTLDGTTLTSLVDLVEYLIPSAGVTETPWRGCGDQLQDLALASANATVRTLMSAHGVGGAAYSSIKQGTTAYAALLTGVTRGKALVEAMTDGKHIVPAVPIVHGEADAASTTYQADLEEWQGDLETDIKAITGQAGSIPILISQQSAWYAAASVINSINSNLAMLSAHIANPGKILLVCPKYFLVPSALDHTHLTPYSSAKLGAYYAKAIKKVIADGAAWNPLYPTGAVRTGASIVVTFAGNVGKLVLDTLTVTTPNGAAKGFEYTDGSTPPAISSVALGPADNQVTVTLAGTPTGSGKKLRYAYTPPVGAEGAGPDYGPRGCLRDSDPAVFADDGSPLWNWCVHFEIPVT